MKDLPDGWVSKRLGDLAQVTMGQSPPGSSYNKKGQGTPFFQGKAEFGEKHPTVRQWTTAGTKFAEPGDILMSVRAPVGPTNIADTYCSIGRGLAGIRAGEALEQSYLIWYLKHVEASIQARGKGTTFDAISGNDLRDTVVNLPPLHEQRRIVETLDDHLSRLDKALAELNEGLVASDVFTRSLLKAAFDGQLTDSEEPSNWETMRIGDVVDFAPKKPNHLKASKEVCSFLPMAAVQEVTGDIDLSQTISHEKALAKTLTFFNEGDVLFAKVTPCMENGKIAVARGLTNQMGYGSTEFHVLSPKESLLADYLRYFLVSKDFRVNAASAMTGAVGLRRVPKSYLQEHHLPLPGLDDQQKVVEMLNYQLSIVDQLKSSIYAHISRIAGLRRSLLHSAFAGKLSEEA